MTKIIDIFNMDQATLADPVEFSKFFLERIKEFPGKKIGVVGRSQSGSTTSFEYLASLKETGVNGRTFASYNDTRGVPDTIIGSLSDVDDLRDIVKSQIPSWYSLFEGQNIVPGEEYNSDPTFVTQAINKVVSETDESLKMFQWKAALTIWCLRDLRCADNHLDPEKIEFYELPSLPIDYNQYFEKLIFIERRPNWFSDPAFEEHFEKEELDSATEISLITMRDGEFESYRSATNWNFDYTILNDGTESELQDKILSVLKEIL